MSKLEPMNFSLEAWDKALGLLQKIFVIFGIGTGALFFFIRLEHTPSLDAEIRFVAIQNCIAKGELALRNIGTWPFELEDVYVLAGSDTDQAIQLTEALHQTLAANESASILFDMPLNESMYRDWVPVKLTLRLDKDKEDQWRISNQWIDFGSVDGTC